MSKYHKIDITPTSTEARVDRWEYHLDTIIVDPYGKVYTDTNGNYYAKALVQITPKTTEVTEKCKEIQLELDNIQ